MERLPAEEQARPRRHIAALSGRHRAMAETYGEAGGSKQGGWARRGCGCGSGAGLSVQGAGSAAM